MSTPITFSGFNNIDFSTVINSLMAAASQPLTDMQTHQSAVKAQISTLGALTAKVNTLDTAVTALADATQFSAYGATVDDSTAAAVTTTGDAVPGHYDLVVKELARAQVTASASTMPDAKTTAVATGGALTINGTTVTISGATTLKGLADAINAKPATGVHASVVQSGLSAYRLVLTGTATGAAGAFTVTNTLTGGSGISFTDTDGDGTSGDSAADNAIQATNADIIVNGIEAIGSSNTFDSVIPGATLTVTRKNPSATVGIDVVTDSSGLQTQINAFISAYNDLTKFFSDQNTSAAQGGASSLGHEPFMRALRTQLRSIVTAPYGSDAYNRLSTIGIEATQSGTLQLNQTVFNDAIASRPATVKALFTGTTGAFATMQTALDTNMATNGLLATAKNRMNDAVSTLDTQIATMQARLAVQRTSLQQEFTAADAVMTSLKSQSTSLANSTSTLSTF